MKSRNFLFNINEHGTAVFLGPTESRLMELAWNQSSVTVKSVIFHLGHETAPAYTTVMTILGRLTDKGLLERTRDGRNFVYRATIGRDAFIKNRVNHVLLCLKKNFPRFLEE